MKYLVVWPILILGMVMFVEFCFWVLDGISYLIHRRKEKQLIRDYVENPVEMVNDRGEVFWVGYKK